MESLVQSSHRAFRSEITGPTSVSPGGFLAPLFPFDSLAVIGNYSHCLFRGRQRREVAVDMSRGDGDK